MKLAGPYPLSGDKNEVMSKRLPLKEKALQGMFPGQDPGAQLAVQGGLASVQGLTDPGFIHTVLALQAYRTYRVAGTCRLPPRSQRMAQKGRHCTPEPDSLKAAPESAVCETVGVGVGMRLGLCGLPREITGKLEMPEACSVSWGGQTQKQPRREAKWTASCVVAGVLMLPQVFRTCNRPPRVPGATHRATGTSTGCWLSAFPWASCCLSFSHNSSLGTGM